MVRELRKKRSQGAISLQKDGSLSLSQPIMERLGYKDGDRIVIAITDTNPLAIGLRLAKSYETDRDYTLGYLYKDTQNETTGGRLSCVELAEELKANIKLPQRSIPFGFPPNWKYDVLILPVEIDWKTNLFDRKQQSNLPDSIGVYQLLSKESEILYIGQGNIKQNFRTHLQNGEMLQDVVYFQYSPCSPRHLVTDSDIIVDLTFEEDALFLQKQLLGIYYEESGSLPKYNSRWF